MTTLGTLRADIQSYLLRSDAEFVAQIPGFVRNAEARLRREVVHSAQEIITTLNAAGRVTPVPTDMVECRSLSYNNVGCAPLELVTPQVLREGPWWDSSGDPRYFSIEGRNFVFAPALPETGLDLDIVYYQQLLPLTDDEQTNFLLTNAYDMYLNLCLAEASKFIKHDEDVMVYMAAYADCRDALLQQDNDYISRGSARRPIGSRYRP